jgi:exopolyphosphatase/guanosine-5'-triphosphate,3'-diphosphate pyrophosphatase
MVVFEGDRRSPAVLFNERIMCALGASLIETGTLDPQGKERAIRALHRFSAIAVRLRVGALAAVATAAVRDSSDGVEFCAAAEAETGIRITIASGADEARLAAQGVMFGEPGAHGVVVDLGGASMELCRIENGVPGPGITTPLGPQRLMAEPKKGETVPDLDACFDDLAGRFRLGGLGRLYLVGGAWRALARVHMERMNYPLRVLHEFTLSAAEARDLGKWAAKSTPEEIAESSGVSHSRMPMLPTAGGLLGRLVKTLNPGDVMVSSFGLREGICLEHMPPSVHDQDPLLASCRAQEKLRARAPGFGADLATWVKTVLPPLDADEDRLIEAAARLADVNWRTHPDYRVAGSWETVTRTTITDIGHAGRVFLGAILSTRYKRSWRQQDKSPVLGLLDEGVIARAVRIGLAFRLGVVLSGSTPGILSCCKVIHAPGRLDVALEGRATELDGEEVEKRLRHLTGELGVEGVIRTQQN